MTASRAGSLGRRPVFDVLVWVCLASGTISRPWPVFVQPTDVDHCPTNERPRGAFYHPLSQQIEFGPSEHLPFDQFQLVDVPFRLPVAPWQRQGGLDRGAICFQSRGKTAQFLSDTSA